MIKREIKRFADAIHGLLCLFRYEKHAQIHLIALALVVSGGVYFNISLIEWIAVVFAIGLVITAEALNTAIEKLGDFVHKDKHENMRIIKDMSAGAVLFAAITSIIIAGIIFIPKF